MDGRKRREKILEVIAAADGPVSASALARRFGVSRQVIVSDVSLLRAGGHGVVATPRGYMNEMPVAGRYVERVAVRHKGEETRSELAAIVRVGGVVVDVTVTHPYYGDLTGTLNIATESDVEAFVAGMNERKGRLLSDLTGGVHTHTVSCADRAAFDKVTAELARLGFLVDAR